MATWLDPRARKAFIGLRCTLFALVGGLALGCDPLPECYTDQDCDTGLTCASGECVQACTNTSTCEGDAECHGVSPADDGTWRIAPQCEAEAVCDCGSSADTCVEIDDVKSCVQIQAGCTFRSCDPGYECVQMAGTASCLCSGDDCGPRCSSNDQCASGSCRSGRCAKRECEEASECGSGFVCVVDVTGSGVCEAKGESVIGDECASSMACESGHCTLLNGSTTCQTSCTRDNDCDDDERCATDQSYQAGSGGTCVSDAICGDTNRPVIAGGIVACGSTEACEADTDCPAPGACTLGQCTCPTGACEQSCDDATDCAAGLVCVDDTCSLPIACETSEDCPNDTVCATNPAQWAAGTHCTPAGSIVVGERCESSGDCASGLCIDGTCEVECEATADCASGECSQRALAGGAFALLCSPTSCECGATEVCLRDGTCREATSCLLTPCPDGESCVGGICRVSCRLSADCADGQSCTLSVPDNAYLCAQNDCACEATEVCSNGQCIAAAGCRLDSECESGLCLAGQCQTQCETERDCDGRECLATLTDTGTHLLCGTFGCGCGPDSWCDPLATIPTCYQEVNCDVDDCEGGYDCVTTVPANYFANSVTVTSACQCTFPLECGKPCEDDDECAVGESCSARQTCAPENVCETNADCDQDEDCVMAQTDVLNATSEVRLVGQCEPEGCGCTESDDVCVRSELDGVCVSLGEQCSVLGDSCADDYRCDATLGLCVCDEPEECGGGCEETADCAPDRICEEGRCIVETCETDDSCPDGTICGGPTRDRCVQPGPKADFEVCTVWSECESAYCFANNTCATPCDDNSCTGELTCQMFEPEEYPNERPICHAEPSGCDPACEPGQFCDNAEEATCQPPIQL